MLKTLVLTTCVLAIPAVVRAQAAIAGTVSDQTGAAVPNVRVEASSAALIEKIRTGVTDGSGRYRIADLRPGVYRVRFLRPGWSPVEHTGIELAGSFTAVVDATLVAAIAETITVARDTPIIDTQTAGYELTLGGELLKSIPTVRTYNALLALVPGVLTNANDIVTSTAATQFPIYGGRSAEGRLMVDGLLIGSPPSGNSATNYSVDVGNAQEVTFRASGVLGEVETAGVVMNVVPKSGGNTMEGSFFVSATGEHLQADNLTDALRAQGFSAASPLTRVYDVSGTIGGPIAKDRIWYFINAHTGGSTKEDPAVYYNLNAGTPSAWLYAPDTNRRAYSDRTFENVSGRFTWQIAPRHKLATFVDAQSVCRKCTGATAGLSEPQRISPEAVGILGRPLYVAQATWSSPITDRLLLEAGLAGTYFGVGNFEREPNPTRDLIRVAEQCANGCAANGNIPGLVYRSQDYSVANTGSYLWKAALSHITGSHNLKIGVMHALLTDDRTWFTNSQNLTYRLSNGAPNQLTQSISPWVNDARAGWDALFAQEQWTRGRLTLQGAVRFDRAGSWFPAQQEGPSRFLPNPIAIPETRGVHNYTDLSPRAGAAYDLFGNGRTALRVSLGRYLDAVGTTGNYANTNPTLRLPQTTNTFGTAGVTRSWTDANSNFTPDCDLSNAAAQDLRPSGGDLCGVLSNTNFGRYVLTNNFDPGVLAGWGVRPSDWNFGASVQQQVSARASLEVAYTRRWFHGFFAADNLATGLADLTPFSVTAPLDPRLPGGGGYVISGLYDVVPEKAGQVDNLVTDASRFGAWTQVFNGVDIRFNVRMRRGVTISGGTSTGQTVADNCGVRAQLPEISTAVTGTSTFGAGLANSAVTPVSPYCHAAYGILTQFRGLGAYEIPRAGVQVAATFQSKPGAMLAANYAVPNDAVVPSLGRNLSGNAPNVTVNLVAPGEMYGDRVNELDVRAAKTLRLGRSKALVAFDLYNTLNSSATLTYNNAFVPNGTWLQPLMILTPRFLRITAQIDF